MNPYSMDHSWKERVVNEQKHANSFWSRVNPETTEALGFSHTLRKPEPLVPKHSYAPSIASSVRSGTRVTAKTNQTHRTHKSTKSTTSQVTAYTGASSRTTATAVLFDRLNDLESKLKDEKSRRGQVEAEVNRLMRLKNCEDGYDMVPMFDDVKRPTGTDLQTSTVPHTFVGLTEAKSLLTIKK
eukprot:CAMPEP_0118943378 /NCGR_PEP_ID=MMETSP1169-20130426/38197_1 /TAXON_ID=36882 /ORGANISM="Pyramimonas obovata, Strain CCMP722" /LENGTH=183 /DNA_ID=CAMNT_0006888623 /DNA_START=235 /DNA_END=786 /DNA_ORIENTATION=-